jgi:hypothetical protein
MKSKETFEEFLARMNRAQINYNELARMYYDMHNDYSELQLIHCDVSEELKKLRVVIKQIEKVVLF